MPSKLPFLTIIAQGFKNNNGDGMKNKPSAEEKALQAGVLDGPPGVIPSDRRESGNLKVTASPVMYNVPAGRRGSIRALRRNAPMAF